MGASDHSYSEALYLKDPEGNEIEIYVDKDISEWNILEDGTINVSLNILIWKVYCLKQMVNG